MAEGADQAVIEAQAMPEILIAQIHSAAMWYQICFARISVQIEVYLEHHRQ